MASAVQEFLTLSSSCDLSDSKGTNTSSGSNGNASPIKAINTLEVCMQKSHRQLLEEGRRVIVEFYADCTANLLPKLLDLYPLDNRVSELAVSLMKGQVGTQMGTMVSHLKAYGLRKLKEAYALTVKQHSKGPNKHAMSTQRSKQHTTTFEMATTSCPVTQQLLVVDSASHLRTALTSLLEFFDITTSIEAIVVEGLRSDILSEFTQSRLSFVAKNDYLLSGTASEKSICILRNRLAKFFITIHKVSCCMVEWAQCSGFSMTMKIPCIRIIPNIDALSIAAENMAAMYTAVTDCIACSVVEVQTRLGLDSQVVRGKLIIDVVKFVTLSVPMILYVDVLLTATRHHLSSDDGGTSVPQQWEAVDGLLAMVQVQESAAPAMLPLLSDVLFRPMHQSILSEGSFVKMLSCVGKRKNSAAFEACRSVEGLQEAASRALAFVIGKYIHHTHRHSHRGHESRSLRENKRAHMKALLGDDLFAVVEQHITPLM